MKILALDIGDAWTGSALSDALGMFAQPYKTIRAENLNEFLTEVLKEEPIKTVVIGYPKTLRGTESDQTKKVVAHKEKLETTFPDVNWVLWDERLTSKQASGIKRAKTKEEKQESHSIAAALILTSYLDRLRFLQNS